MRKRFVVAYVLVTLAAAIAFSVLLYRSQCEVTNLQRQVFNMESRLRIATAKCR